MVSSLIAGSFRVVGKSVAHQPRSSLVTGAVIFPNYTPWGIIPGVCRVTIRVPTPLRSRLSAAASPRPPTRSRLRAWITISSCWVGCPAPCGATHLTRSRLRGWITISSWKREGASPSNRPGKAKTRHPPKSG